MKLAIVKKGVRNGPIREYCPWMIAIPPEGGK
jgi:hypothetical protein